MTGDSTRGGPDRSRPEPRPPRWRFHEALLERHELREPVTIPFGAEFVSVSTAYELRLLGEIDPGDAEWLDSYLPTVRVGGRSSSRMTRDDDGVRFAFYPEVEGELEGGEIEFRARLGDEFERTGLRI